MSLLTPCYHYHNYLDLHTLLLVYCHHHLVTIVSLDLSLCLLSPPPLHYGMFKPIFSYALTTNSLLLSRSLLANLSFLFIVYMTSLV
jgi:hypothetical protein